jgi:hypothetical protein
MRTVPLGGGKAAGRVALVDDEDYELVSQYRWHVQVNKRTPDLLYALTNIWRDGRRTTQKMNTMITGWPLTDHIDRDGLNNQRSNLRPATNGQNQMNCKGHPAIRAGRFKGVHHNPDVSSGYRAYIGLNGETHVLGWFDDDVSAALVYDAAAREMFGEFARTNFAEGSAATFTPPQQRRKFSSAYRGVSRYRGRIWRARIGQREIGYFADEEEAALAYDAAAREAFGSQARLNFPGAA